MAAREYNPDCGYAWVVVAACFTINFIMAGLTRAAGVLYIALIDVYGVSREVATTPFSLRFCVRNLSGPAVGALGQRFGIRPVVLVGGLICGLGGILSALAPDVTWITAAWGGIHGLGYGMSNIIHVIVINRYFHKYKGLALGMSLTGDCIGTFLLPLVLEFLLSIYDLRGTFLILAGISFNVVPAAMLLKSPAWDKGVIPASLSQKKTPPTKLNNRNFMQGITNQGFDSPSEEKCHELRINNMPNHVLPTITINEPENNEICITSQKNLKDKVKEMATVESGSTRKECMQYIDFCFSDRNKNNLRNDTLINDIYCLRQSVSLRVTEKKMKKKRFRCNIGAFNIKNRRTSISSVLSCPSQVGKSTLDLRRKISANLQIPYSCSTCLESHKDILFQSNQEQTSCLQQEEVLENANDSVPVRKFSLYSNELQTHQNLSIIPVPSHKKEVLTNLKQHEGSTAVEHEIRHDDASGVSDSNYLVNFLKTNTKPIFLVISATLALYAFLFISVFTIIIDYVNDNDIPSEYGMYLIIAFSVTDFFGRMTFGVVLDKKWISMSHFAGLTVSLMGFCVVIIPFYKCFNFWMISFGLCGFIQGGTAIMFPMLVEHYMDKNEETVALGSSNFYAGILMLLIPPMIGYFRDNIGSYDGVFWTVGSMCIFVGSLWIFEPCLIHKQKKRTEETSQNEEELNNR